jgi:hypothetical protein
MHRVLSWRGSTEPGTFFSAPALTGRTDGRCLDDGALHPVIDLDPQQVALSYSANRCITRFDGGSSRGCDPHGSSQPTWMARRRAPVLLDSATCVPSRHSYDALESMSTTARAPSTTQSARASDAFRKTNGDCRAKVSETEYRVTAVIAGYSTLATEVRSMYSPRANN